MDSRTMNLFERVKQHWIGGVIAIAFLCMSTTWFAINEILVRPRDFEIEKLTKEHLNLKSELNELKTRIANSKEGELQEEVRNLKIQIEKSDKEVTDLKTRLTNSSRQISDLRFQLANANQHVSDLQSQLTTSNKQLNDLKSQLANSNKQIKDLKSQLASPSKEVNDLKAQLANSNKQVEDLKLQLANSNKQVSDLKSQLANVNKEIQSQGVKVKPIVWNDNNDLQYAVQYIGNLEYPDLVFSYYKVTQFNNTSSEIVKIVGNIKGGLTFEQVKISPSPNVQVSHEIDEFKYEIKIAIES
jgi:DNA repair exonuclease SbcCD ATPase subunit